MVLYLSGTKRVSVDGNATPGFATEFMEKLEVNKMLFGDVIKDTFKTTFKGIIDLNSKFKEIYLFLLSPNMFLCLLLKFIFIISSYNQTNRKKTYYSNCMLFL